MRQWVAGSRALRRADRPHCQRGALPPRRGGCPRRPASAAQLSADLDDQPAAGGVVRGTDLGDGEITAVLAFDVLVQESVLDDELPDRGRELSHVELAIATIDGSNGQLAGYVDHGVTCEKDDPAEAGSW